MTVLLTLGILLGLGTLLFTKKLGWPARKAIALAVALVVCAAMLRWIVVVGDPPPPGTIPWEPDRQETKGGRPTTERPGGP